MRHGKFLFKAAMLAVVALVLAGCGDSSKSSQADSNEVVFRRGNRRSPRRSIRPSPVPIRKTISFRDMLIGLMTYDAKANTIPGMATSWETSPDGLTWTFHLRDAQMVRWRAGDGG